MIKETKVVVLDYLPHGYHNMKKIEPIIQAIGYNYFILFEMVANKEVKPQDIISIDDKERIKYIRRKIKEKDLTNFSKNNLEEVIIDIVKQRESDFVNFFNKAVKISIRMHQLELLPGIGKKHVQIILKQRKVPFKSFEDIKKRVGITVDIERMFARRIIEELKFFVQKNRSNTYIKIHLKDYL